VAKNRKAEEGLRMAQMNTDQFKPDPEEQRDPITHDIIGAAFEVHRVLGYGFLEKARMRAIPFAKKMRCARSTEV
jgi:hypothetical protein